MGSVMRKTQVNNTSGITGYCLVQRRNKGRGKPTLAVRAQWREDGRVRGTSYSVSLHGPIKACELAIDARERGLLINRGGGADDEWIWSGEPAPRQLWAAIRNSEPKAG
jgi:hypothetical protein